MKNKLVLLILVLICMLSVGCGKKDETGTVADVQTTTTAEGQEVYVLEFEAATVDGEKITSECFTDSKLTMINVWATYCSPCLSEMPDLGEIAAAYDKSEFQIMGIVCDVMSDAKEADIQYVKELINTTKADYPHLLLNESLYINLVGAVESVPTTFFVNQKGELLGYVVGAQSKSTWEGIINDLLADIK